MELTEEQIPEVVRLLAQHLDAEGMALRAPERTEPFTVREAAEALRLSPSTINTEIKAKRWPLMPRTGRNLIPVWAVRVRQAGGDPMVELRRIEKAGWYENFARG